MECQDQKDKYHMILSHVESKTADRIEIRSELVAARDRVGARSRQEVTVREARLQNGSDGDIWSSIGPELDFSSKHNWRKTCQCNDV